MNQTLSRKNDNRKMLPYLALLAVTSFIIAHLNIFPGAVSFEQTREGIDIIQGSIEKTTVTLDVEDYETSDWLRLSILQSDINTLQKYLASISLLIPISLYFLIEHKRIEVFHLSAKVKLISFTLVFILLYLALAFGYAEALERIGENLTAILGGK